VATTVRGPAFVPPPEAAIAAAPPAAAIPRATSDGQTQWMELETGRMREPHSRQYS